MLACLLCACGSEAPERVPSDAGPPDAGDEDAGLQCDAPLEACDGACVDLATDDANCGECGHACEGASGCFGGACGTPPPMPTARVAFGAALGSDGRIYLVGGIGSDATMLATVDAYDPRTNAWTTAAPLAAPRALVGAATGSDGLLYALLGLASGGGVSAAVEAYDPAADAWSAQDDAPVSKLQFAVTADADGGIYVVAGSSGMGPVATADLFGATDASWDRLGDLGTARQGLAATTGADGRIWAIAGGVPDGASARSMSEVEVYDPSVDGWEAAPPTGTLRFEPAAVTLPDGRIWALGGHGALHETLETTEVFDAGAWTEGPPMGEPRAGHAAVVGRDGRVYVFGGHGASEANVLSSLEVWDPVREIWIR